MGGRGAGIKAEGGGHRRSLGDKAVGKKVAAGGDMETDGRTERGREKGAQERMCSLLGRSLLGQPRILRNGQRKSQVTRLQGRLGVVVHPKGPKNEQREGPAAIHLFGCSEGRAMQDQGCEDIKGGGRGYLDRCGGNSFNHTGEQPKIPLLLFRVGSG